MRLALDLTHAAHSSAQTGIQQVARGLAEAFPALCSCTPIVFDKYADRWRAIDRREANHLATVDAREGVRRKRPHWSTWQRLRGRWQRRCGVSTPITGSPFDAILLPEFFAEWVGPRIPELRAAMPGPIAAIFHDAIAFHHPEWGVRETIARYPQYLRELAQVDAVACVSEFSRLQLLAAFEQLGIRPRARIEAIPLGLRTRHLPAAEKTLVAVNPRPHFLCVGTIEPRKNHAALLAAAARLWAADFDFELTCVGMLNRGSGAAVAREIERLQAEGRPLRWVGAVAAPELARLYAETTATVFPSLCEGFGLPVLESLHFGKPCLSSNAGALAEVATGPGVAATEPTADALEALLRRFLSEPAFAEKLAREAEARPVRTMDAYAGDLLHFLQLTAERA